MNPVHAYGAVARVLSRRPIHWEGPPRADEADRTPHVRAASGVGWLGERLVVIQDDASYLALVDPTTARARSLALPHEAMGRRRFESALGNKADKLDLEALATWRAGRAWHFLAVGSGSTAARERWVYGAWDGGEEPTLRLVDAAETYAALRAEARFAGAELNVEGAVAVGRDLVLFQRGNGQPSAERPVVDATIAIDLAALQAALATGLPLPAPRPETVRAVDLGALGGVRLTFTDAAVIEGALWYLACAEDSPNTYDDGRVVGSVVGRIDGDGVIVDQRRLVDLEGRPIVAKTEGLVAGREAGRAWIVVDMDDPDVPAELWDVEL